MPRSYAHLTMWKPALFLVTIVLVTPSGRAAFSEYYGRMTEYVPVYSPYYQLVLIALALCALGIFLLMLCRSPKNQDTGWVRRQIRGEVADNTSHYIPNAAIDRATEPPVRMREYPARRSASWATR